MFKEMRRRKQLLSAEDSAAVLNRGTSGVLALLGDDGYPYAVSLLIAPDGSAVLAETEDGKLGYTVTR